MRALRKRRGKGGKLPIDRLEVLNRIPSLASRNVDQMHQKTAALHMAQKFMPESKAVARSFNQTGNVGHYIRNPFIYPHHPKLRLKRGKMVVCDLGPGRRNHRKKRGFPHVGEADQPHIGQQLELQQHIGLFALCPVLGKAGRLPRGGRKTGVSKTAFSSSGGKIGLAVRHVVQQKSALALPNQSSSRYADDQVLPALSGTVLPCARSAVFRGIFAVIAKIQKGGEIVVHLKDDIAACAAVSPVGAAGSDIFFPMKGDGSVSSGPRPNMDFCNVDKHGLSPSQKEILVPLLPKRQRRSKSDLQRKGLRP